MNKSKMKLSAILSRLSFILLIISVDSMYVLPFLFEDFPLDWLIQIIIPILYVLSVISLFLIKKEIDGDQLKKRSMVIIL